MHPVLASSTDRTKTNQGNHPRQVPAQRTLTSTVVTKAADGHSLEAARHARVGGPAIQGASNHHHHKERLRKINTQDPHGGGPYKTSGLVLSIVQVRDENMIFNHSIEWWPSNPALGRRLVGHEKRANDEGWKCHPVLALKHRNGDRNPPHDAARHKLLTTRPS